MTENNNKPTILQLLPSLKSGGVERGTIDIASAADKFGFNCLVASSGGPLTSKLATDQHITMSLDSKNPLTIYRNYLKLVEIIRKHNVKILHARSRAPAWSAYLAAKKTNCILLTTFHGVYSFSNRLKKFYNSIMVKGNHVIAVSNFIKNHIIENYGTDAAKISVIHRGADLEYFQPENVSETRILQIASNLHIPFDRPIITLPGRITRWKGQEVLLKALALLPRNSVYCIIVGDDKGHQSYRKELESFIAGQQLTNDVIIIPHVSDIAALYMLSDIVVSASTRPEAFGRVATESQAMGRMIIASNIGGSCETVIDGKTGWLVPEGDSQALADAITKSLSLSLEERKAISSAARKNVEDSFSLEKMYSDTFAVYKKLLDI